jgi:hypothetical protein
MLILFIILGFLSVSCAVSEGKVKNIEQPLHEKLTKAAWDAYNAKEYDKAIEMTDKCIDEFEATAFRMQGELKKEPSTGTVSDDIKEEIFKNGVLNDVATCWFIKGRSLERLNKIEGAIQAYCKTSIYKYARTYDPNWKGFWSPSQATKDRLPLLRGTCDK